MSRLESRRFNVNPFDLVEKEKRNEFSFFESRSVRRNFERRRKSFDSMMESSLTKTFSEPFFNSFNRSILKRNFDDERILFSTIDAELFLSRKNFLFFVEKKCRNVFVFLFSSFRIVVVLVPVAFFVSFCAIAFCFCQFRRSNFRRATIGISSRQSSEKKISFNFRFDFFSSFSDVENFSCPTVIVNPQFNPLSVDESPPSYEFLYKSKSVPAAPPPYNDFLRSN